MQELIKKEYCRIYKLDESTITAVCSRHLVIRAAGSIYQSIIPCNPLLHLDYNTSDIAYQRQCENQDNYKHPVKCLSKNLLLDVVNIWFPTTKIEDWTLGFIPIDKTLNVDDTTI